MKQLTYAEIELLQYTLKMYMKDNTSHKDYLDSLYNKLIAMRAQLESSKYYKDLTPEEVMNTI
jgi:predicted RNase H-like nuclease